jgi:hypothetical protein
VRGAPDLVGGNEARIESQASIGLDERRLLALLKKQYGGFDVWAQ